MDALDVHTLLETPAVQLLDVCCPGLPIEPTKDEFTSDLRLVFPYRGVFVRHVGRIRRSRSRTRSFSSTAARRIASVTRSRAATPA